MPDSNAEERLLLGTVGWARHDWLRDYYPDDLPRDWRLAYYANDCSCLFLRAADWCETAPQQLEEMLQEAAGRLLFFLEQGPAGWQHCPNMALFGSESAVLLVDNPDPSYGRLPQWCTKGEGAWVDSDSDATLLLWSIDELNLRSLRTRAEKIGPGVKALVLDGPGADPRRVPELRAMLELMGKAG